MTESSADISIASLRKKVEERLRAIGSHPLTGPVLQDLEQNLDASLSYHNVDHTKEVLFEAVLLGLIDGLSERDLDLLGIACAFHDSGFLVRHIDNECLAADKAAKAMRESGDYVDDEIDIVRRMILDTALRETPTGPKQIPKTKLSRYLLDADLANLGRDDFFLKAEAQRLELDAQEDLFLEKTLELVSAHEWYTDAARQLREEKKQVNIANLRRRLARYRESGNHVKYLGVSLERLGFLTKLPLFLNSSLGRQEVIRRALEQLNRYLDAEAATVFLCNPGTDELTFWALDGGSAQLEGKRIPRGKGIVGWVIDKQESLIVDDAVKDPRFFNEVDKEGTFVTRDILCVPLTVRGRVVVGALQILNSISEDGFLLEDLIFLEHVGHQLALAIDNAQMYETLKTKNQQLAALDRRKGEIISLISHEFKTPLNIIQTSAELIASGVLVDSNAQKEIAETLENGVGRLARLVGQVRNLSYVSTESLKLNRKKVFVPDLVQRIVGQFADVVKQRDLSVRVKLGEGCENVHADRALMLLVLENLVSNAIRFTPDGGEIVVQTNRSAGLVTFSVMDNGIGIEHELQQVIFGKFYEVTEILHHSSGEHEFKSCGLGLGLSTVKAILDAHGAGIVLFSTPGEGSTFSFALPATAAQETTNADAEVSVG